MRIALQTAGQAWESAQYSCKLQLVAHSLLLVLVWHPNV